MNMSIKMGVKAAAYAFCLCATSLLSADLAGQVVGRDQLLCKTPLPPQQQNNREYFVFNYPEAIPGGNTLLTGIRGKKHRDNIVYISGFYNSPGDTSTVPFVYEGTLKGKGKWYVLNYPSSPGVTVTATSLYGPNNGHGADIQVVGNYATVEAGPSALGCLYEGPLDGSGKWTTLLPPADAPVLNTIAHSTMGGLVVGNFDTQLDEGRAFIYDIERKKYFEITKSGAMSITAYGIWHNGGHSYTICGGYGSAVIARNGSPTLGYGYIVEWNNKTRKLSHWRTFSYDNSSTGVIDTHFDGITSDGRGGFNLTGDYVGVVDGPELGFFAHVKHKKSRKAKWSPVSFPDQLLTSGNSVYKEVVIGVFTSPMDSSVNGYVSMPD